MNFVYLKIFTIIIYIIFYSHCQTDNNDLKLQPGDLTLETVLETGLRTIKIEDLDHDLHYIPLRNGEKFIIEIEGSPSTGFIWTLDDLNLKHSLANTLPLIQAINLDKNRSAVFYRKPHKEDKDHLKSSEGIYQFKFKVNDENRTGHETISFNLKNIDTHEGITEKKVNISVSNPKTDL